MDGDSDLREAFSNEIGCHFKDNECLDLHPSIYFGGVDSVVSQS